MRSTRSAIVFAATLVCHALPATAARGFEETADISASISDGRQYVRVGDELTYVIQVRNAGPDDANVFVSDSLPGGLESAFWDCVDASAGATCSSGNGSQLFDIAFVPADGQVTYAYVAYIGPGPHMQPIANTAMAFGHLELIDPQVNNIATDTNIVVLFRADFDPN